MNGCSSLFPELMVGAPGENTDKPARGRLFLWFTSDRSPDRLGPGGVCPWLHLPAIVVLRTLAH